MRILPTEPNDRDRGVTAERERVTGIRRACLASKMSREFEETLIESGKSLEACQSDVFAELDRRGYGDVGPQNVTVRERGLDGDAHIHQTEGIKEAILHRMDPMGFPLTEKGRTYRGLTMIDIAKLHLQARGMRVTDMTKNEIAATALGMRGVGMHTTSDFPYLLADVAVKSLRKAYEEAPQTWVPMARPVTLTNYRATSITQLGDAPELLEVVEHGEYKSGTMGEAREQIQLRKYGRKFSITREAMINDDLGAFSRVPANFGRKARAKQSDLVWEQITSNPTMGDTYALFSLNHNNIAATDAAIDITSLGAARSALRQQRSVDGEYLNLMAKFLIVPPGMETLAEQYVTVIQPQVGTNVNPFAGKLTVVTDPRLTNEDEWYVAAGPEFEWLIYGYLEGEEGPQVDTRNGFDIDGLEIKCRLDFAAKVIDWRGIYRNEGNT
jgi:phage major head subunit gpT-like protein